MYLLSKGFLSVLKPDVSPTIRQISVLKIPAIFELNRSLGVFDKPGVADVSFRYPFDICNNFMDFDSLESLNIPQLDIKLRYWQHTSGFEKHQIFDKKRPTTKSFGWP